MENKGKQKYNPRDDMSLDQAILQWIVDDYDIPDEKSRKIVGESGKKSKLITCKMVMDYLDNRGVVEETDETEFMRALRKRLYYAIDTVVGPIPMKLKSIDAHELLRQKKQAKGRFHVTSANAEFFMYLLWCNEDRADNDDILWLIKNERSYEASELFTSFRIKRDTVPDGLYAYDVRHDDDCRGIPCEIAPFIMVNHWGTIILAEPLELPDDGRRYIDEETDWNYDPFGGAEKNQKPCVTVEEFMNQYLDR